MSKQLHNLIPIYMFIKQCLKWTVAQLPNVTNILFGDQKLLQIRQSLAQQKTFGRLPKRPLKIVVLLKPDIFYCNFQRQITLLFQWKTVCYERSDWSKYIFVANEYTANVIYCSPQLCIFIEPINTRFLHVFM